MKMQSVAEVCSDLAGRLIVSCQAPEGSPLRDPRVLARMAQASVMAGAAGIRADGPENIAAIRKLVRVPIIGIAKRDHEDGHILITPSFNAAEQLTAAGAGLIALDCTARGQKFGALGRIGRIKRELGVPVLADVATVDEALQAVAAGADFILTTLRGYTPETEHVRAFDFQFLRDVVRAVDVPVIAEGRIRTPAEAAAALDEGAFAVIVGSAITRPDEVARRFARAIEQARGKRDRYAIGIDLGGTNTKAAIVKRDGSLFSQVSVPTPANDGREALLEHLRAAAGACQKIAAEQRIELAAVGIATAGWVDPVDGSVVYATGNLPGWMGAPIRAEMERATGLPVGVENDANALAAGERYFGLATDIDDFVCITLGTGVGGGCYVGGRLNRGAHFMANAIGHINLLMDGLPCTCGRRGCLEAYANAAALVRYAGPRFQSAESVIQSANAGDAEAREAIRIYAGWLARGCAQIVNLLDPELLVISGGIAQNNPLLLEELERGMEKLAMGFEQRVRVEVSPLACFGGVIGAAAVALDAAAARGWAL